MLRPNYVLTKRLSIGMVSHSFVVSCPSVISHNDVISLTKFFLFFLFSLKLWIPIPFSGNHFQGTNLCIFTVIHCNQPNIVWSMKQS